MTIRVVVLSEHDLIEAGLLAVLGRFTDRITSEHGPRADADIVLWSSFGAERLPDFGAMKADHGAAHLVVLCWNFEPGLVAECLAAGASGYLGTALSGEELVRALERIQAGEVVVATADGTEHGEVLTQWPGSAQGLSEREADIVALIASGFSNDEIARQLYLSINTVKSYIRTAYQKMGVGTRSQAVLWGVEHGFRRRTLRPQRDLA